MLPITAIKNDLKKFTTFFNYSRCLFILYNRIQIYLTEKTKFFFKYVIDLMTIRQLIFIYNLNKIYRFYCEFMRRQKLLKLPFFEGMSLDRFLPLIDWDQDNYTLCFCIDKQIEQNEFRNKSNDGSCVRFFAVFYFKQLCNPTKQFVSASIDQSKSFS